MRFSHYVGSALVLCLMGSLAATEVRGQSGPVLSSSPVVSFNTLPVLQPTTPIPGSSHIPDDFNGDGTSDLLWFNPTLSQVGYWTMNANVAANVGGSTVTRTGVSTFNVTTGYFVGAVGDFNGDGYADLVFTSPNHDLWLWTNNQHGGWTSTKIGNAAYPSQWQLIGAGDVDGDGHDDLLWLDPSECKFGYWTMNGATVTSTHTINVACGYYPVSVGYYSPSNRLSILWTSPANDLYIWDSTASGFKSYNLTPYVSYNLTLTGTWAMGGGTAGADMFIESYGGPQPQYACAQYSRIFDVNGNQTDVVKDSFCDGGVNGQPGVGAYLIQNNNSGTTGFYGLDQSSDTISTEGLVSTQAPFFYSFNSWTFPAGWYLVGAPAYGIAASLSLPPDMQP
ncbi:VCBS repeat-containing protein [Dyella dinghuensis]|uniref:VCBS repeat-containing protein n=1 Tax=Dyella dinghuensis TaxID=1920169 RepID=A0A3S0RGT5_9GAMM|nr:VCBS repeat-containing protein [Dyella dinghuensis]RUL67105.1 VCBS repeat-containing protein [Dyella dinghuensis]